MIVVTGLLIHKVLQKPDIASQMVCWTVELSEFDIQYEPRGPIKGQVYADFVVELSSKDLAPTVGPDKTRSHSQSCGEPPNNMRNMRNTRQGSAAPEGGDNVTMQ